jgi:hypothetical protein
MMKRIFMLLALALMVVAAMALSGVAQAASPKAKCQQEAETLTGLDLTGSNFIVGNNKKNDNFTSKNTQGSRDVFCGFGGNDEIATLDADDIFIGGAGGDAVAGGANYGIFYGGDGRDGASTNYGTLYGDAGDDSVQFNYGTFNGGDGNDSVTYPNESTGTFNQDAL